MKSGNLFDDFVWRRARGGYIWKEVLGGLLLVPANAKDAAEDTYRLGDKANTGLFMQFAELDQTPEAFLAFANEFGTLGQPVTVDYAEVPGKDFKIRIRRSLAEPRRATASEWPMPFYEQPMKPFAKPLPHSLFIGEFYSLGDYREPSWLQQVRHIRRLIEARQKLRKGTSQSRLGFDADFVMRDAVSLTLDDRLAGRLAPVSLMGALWLQAALAGDKEYRNCPMCSTPIEISRTGGARADAKFCSDKCKSKDYRQRRATARSLHDDGVALRKIAKQIDRDLETVKNWLK